MNDHLEWLHRVTSGESGRAIADQSGLSPATVNRQISRGSLSAEVVIDIARGYGQSPVDALVATGYIAADEAGTQSPEALAQLLDDRSLIRELARRIESAPGYWDGTFEEALDAPSDLDDYRCRRWSMPEGAVADWSPEDYDGTEDDWTV